MLRPQLRRTAINDSSICFLRYSCIDAQPKEAVPEPSRISPHCKTLNHDCDDEILEQAFVLLTCFRIRNN
ncbi:hypothetical protein ABKN59_009820 [Abortiporus biennis]